MCFGGDSGGGGDDGGAAAREAARQARIDAGTRAVNALFGIGNQTDLVADGTKTLTGYRKSWQETDADGNLVNQQSVITPEEYLSSSSSYSGPAPFAERFGVVGSNDGSTYTPIYDTNYTEKPSTIAEAKAAREALYNQTKEDTRAFFAKQLDDDKEKALRQLNFQKARQGIAGSSMSNDIDAEYQKAYDKGLLEIANKADASANDFRTNDEQTRLNLISKIVAGMDQGSAVQNAASTLQTNAQAAKSAYQSQQMANVFSDLLGSYNQGQYLAGQQAAQKQYGSGFGNFFSNSGDTGTISKG